MTGTNDDDEYTVRVVKRVAAPPGRGGTDRRPRGSSSWRSTGSRCPVLRARDARRQRAEHGALGRRRRLRARRVGARPLLADRGQPGGHPARVQRGHPRVPLGGEGDREADDLLGAGRLRGDRAPPRDRRRAARGRRRQPGQPALGRGRRGHPDRQPHGRRAGGQPRLPRVLRQRLQRHAGAGAVRLGDPARGDRGDPRGAARRAPAGPPRRHLSAAARRRCAWSSAT